METDRIVECRVLAEELNFRRAAERLAMSQSSLSRHIDDSEDRLGFRLFLRDRHTVTLTAAGQTFLDAASDIPERLRDAIEASRPGRARSGDLMVRLGYGRTRGLELVELALLDRDAGAQATEIGLIQGSGGHMTPSLLNGELDLAFVRPPVADERLEGLHLVDELLGVVLREDDPLAAAPAVSVEVLLTAPFIAVRPMPGIPAVDSLSATIRDTGLEPRNIVAHADSITSMLLLIESGLGVGLSRQAVFRRANTPGLVIRPITPALPGIALWLAWRRSDASPSLAHLIQLLVASRTKLGPCYLVPDRVPENGATS